MAGIQHSARVMAMAVSIAVPTFAMSVAAAPPAAAAGSGQVAGAPTASTPQTLTSPGQDLVRLREKLRAGDASAKAAADMILARAEKALGAGPYSVLVKKGIAPSGDKHDYVSLSPYWWPDPSKPDGKPYIRRDGEFNPERANYDLESLDKMGDAVDDLTLAYFLTGEERYAAKAAEMVRTWCIDPATRMNPNLKYGQFVPGYDEPRPSGVIEGGRLRKVIDGVVLLRGSKHWSDADDKAARAWFGELLTYITTSPQGTAELGQPNNHGTWAHVQCATYALFLGDKARAKTLLEEPYKRLLAHQIQPDGSQPEEMVRTRSYHYHRFNILALVEMASLGDMAGLDLWSFRTDDGRSLRTAIDYLTPYTIGGKPWPKKDIEAQRLGDMVEIYRRAGNALRDPAYLAAARTLQEKDPRVLIDALFPERPIAPR